MTPRIVLRGTCALVMLAVAVLPAPGCATAPAGAKEKPSRAMGKGVFRGRWWNYYARGRERFDTGLYPDAVKDFETALKGRSTDQRWARTYGLHFLPEYFPNRELGITFYLQGRLEKALKYLEKSHAQYPSARCDYYLGEVRVRLAREAGDDGEPPRIEVTSPREERLAAREYVIEGTVMDGTLVHEVLVGGTPAPLPLPGKSVAFRRTIRLEPGENTVKIVARDLAGHETVESLSLLVDVDGPAVSFDASPSLPGILTGVALDASGVASLEIAGISAALTQHRDGVTGFRVEIAKIPANAPLRYVCSDTLGNRTVGEVRGVKRAASSTPPKPLASRAMGKDGFISGLFVNTVLAAVSTKDEGPRLNVLSFRHLKDGQVFRREDVAVVLDIDAPGPLREVRLTGTPIQFLPDRTFQAVSRRLILALGRNEIHAQLTCANGEIHEVSVTVIREPSPEILRENRLSLAILGEVIEGNPVPLSVPTDYVIDELYDWLGGPKRQRFRMVNREHLDDTLMELKLSELLGSRENRLVLGRLVPAELIGIVVQKYSHTLELKVMLNRAETGVEVAIAEVAGPVETRGDYDRLIRNLALQLEQLFPRVEGTITRVKDGHIIKTDLRESDLVRPAMPLLLLRETDPDWNEREIFGQARVTQVGPDFSIARIVNREAEQSAETPPRKGDIVVTK